jgi:phenylacetate-CoA ligase
VPGELVLTTLGRDACPLLRYRTGDLVHAPDCGTCECGTEDPALEGGILSRVDDMVIVRGVNIYPGAVEAVVRQFAEVEEYRVNVSGNATLHELSIEVEPGPQCGDDAALQQKISDALSTTFSMRIDVAIVASGTLPRFELKASRWIVST